MHNPDSVQENEMHNVLWNFEIQTDHLILARRPDVVIVNKKKKKNKKINKGNLPNSGFCRPARLQSQNKRKWKKEKYLNLTRGEKKKRKEKQQQKLKKQNNYENEDDVDINCNWLRSEQSPKYW